MITAAAGDNRRSFERAKARRCLSGIHDFGGIFPNRFHLLMRRRRDAGKSRQKIQASPFSGKNAPGRPLNFKNSSPAKPGRSVLSSTEIFNPGSTRRKT